MHASKEAGNGYHLFTALINVDSLHRNARHYPMHFMRQKDIRSVKKHAKTALMGGKINTNNYAVVSLSGEHADGSTLNDFITHPLTKFGKIMFSQAFLCVRAQGRGGGRSGV